MKFLEVERVGKFIGRGTFGRVVKLKCKGIGRPLAGKILRDDDLGADEEQAQESVKIFFREYKCLTTLEPHRNIVHYQGLCFVEESEFPVLVMELMSTDLHAFLLSKKNAGLQLDMKITILHEISRGLAYLHDNRIIHRDLTAKNVLMDANNTPKISDFGNSSLIDSVSATSHLGAMTSRIGTLLYMAPEVNTDYARYNKKVDVFSFGHLALFVSIQKFPKFLKPPVKWIGSEGVCLSEVERREEYFKELPKGFPLTPLIRMCLKDRIILRPSSDEVKRQLTVLKGNTSTSGVGQDI